MVKKEKKKHDLYTCPNCGHQWWAVVRPITRCPDCKTQFYPKAIKQIEHGDIEQKRLV